MGYNIGPTLKVDGEKEYTQAMKNVREQMKYISAEAAKLTSVYDKNDKSVEALTARNEGLKKSEAAQQKAVDETKSALDRLRESVGENSFEYKRMEANLNNAEAALNSTRREIRQNEEALEANSAAARENASVMSEKIKGGFNTAAKAATALAVAVAGVSAKLFSITKESGEWADSLITMSNNTGISTQTLQEWQYATRFIDTELDDMTKGLTRVTKSIGESINANREYIKISDGVKVSIKNSNNETRATEEIFYDIIDALGAMTNETERDVATQEIFGKSFQDMNSLIKSGSTALKEYAAEAHEMGVIVDDETVASLGAFDDSMQRVNAKTDAVKTKLANTFLPIFEDISESVLNWLDELSKSDVDKKIMNFIQWVYQNKTPILATLSAIGVGVAGLKIADFVKHLKMLEGIITPTGLIVTGTAALVTVLGSLVLGEYDAAQAMKQSVYAAEERKKSLDELLQSSSDMIGAGIAEADYYENLKKELDGIVDSNGNIKKGYEDRAAFIANELSEYTGIEIDLANGVIEKYGELSKAIDDVIQKQKIQVVSDVLTSELKNLIQQKRENQKEIEELEQEYLNAQAEYSAESQKYADEAAMYEALAHDIGLSQIIDRKNIAEDALNESAKLGNDLNAQIQKTESDLQILMTGSGEEIDKILYENGIIAAETAETAGANVADSFKKGFAEKQSEALAELSTFKTNVLGILEDTNLSFMGKMNKMYTNAKTASQKIVNMYTSADFTPDMARKLLDTAFGG